MCNIKSMLMWFLTFFVQNLSIKYVFNCPDEGNVTVIQHLGPLESSVSSNTIVNEKGCLKSAAFFTNIEINMSCNNQTIVNKLKKYFITDRRTLETIYIYNCPITSIEPEVFISVPVLKNITVMYPYKAKPLHLRRNVFNIVPSLEFIKMQSGIVYIEDGAFSNLWKLKHLDLSGNRLINMSENWLTNSNNIKELSLALNNLTKIEKDMFKNCPNLELLSLSGNQISVIHKGSFGSLEKLKVLNLEQNKLTTISWNILPSTSSLITIDLSQNEINYLSELFLETTVKENTYVSLWGNPIVCSCLNNIFNWMYVNKIKPNLLNIKNPNGVNCAVCVVDRENPQICEKMEKPVLTTYFKDSLCI